MNDNLLIAAVLREVAEAAERAEMNMTDPAYGITTFVELIAHELRSRAAELDPPEKNEQNAKVADFTHVSGTVSWKVPKQ